MKLRYGAGDWRESEHVRFERARHIIAYYLLNRGGYMAGWPARLRAVWHAGICLYDGEICKDCGRPVVRGIWSWWRAPDELWMRINGGFAGTKCPACFAEQCSAKGIQIHWLATSDEGTR
jgi:hypothetical protein